MDQSVNLRKLLPQTSSFTMVADKTQDLLKKTAQPLLRGDAETSLVHLGAEMFLVVGPIPVIVTRLEDGRLQVSVPTHIPVRVALTHSAASEPQALLLPNMTRRRV